MLPFACALCVCEECSVSGHTRGAVPLRLLRGASGVERMGPVGSNRSN